MQYLQNQAELERIAEEILTEKQLIIDLDRRRNENRMALASFRQGKMKDDKRVYFFAGGLFMKLPKESAKQNLEKDQQNIDAEISRLRDSLKDRTRDLELKEKGKIERTKGFELKGIGKDELRSMVRHPVTD
ncbi:hypothetical protein SpCBS45565_g07027 [Spizellomyces sp. 'palustris']|nr:hypothetical protein SpCBS45565_g07027 [Spizellomyces sp. 'palustris']